MDTPNYRPLAIDLFAGCGGLTEGLKQARVHVVAAVEIDPLAVHTYRVNHPEVEVWNKDIREVAPRHLKRQLHLQTGQLDILAACPPCQGFSSLRTLNGKHSIDDPNNALLFQFLYFIKELKPKVVMMENVPGLAKDNRLENFLSVLQSLGYIINDQSVRVLNASDYGVPQRRRRMILMASRLGIVPFAQPVLPYTTVSMALANMTSAGESGDPLHDHGVKLTPSVLHRIRRIPANGGSRSALGSDEQLLCHQKLKGGFRDIYGRMAWDAVAPTITGGCTNPSKGRFLHPVEHRPITLREAAILQSFPRDYYFSMERGKLAVAQMIGNALPPEFIRRQAECIVDFLANNDSSVAPLLDDSVD